MKSISPWIFRIIFIQGVYNMILEEKIRYAAEFKNYEGYANFIEGIKNFIGIPFLHVTIHYLTKKIIGQRVNIYYFR